jgi:hypothetical protein
MFVYMFHMSEYPILTRDTKIVKGCPLPQTPAVNPGTIAPLLKLKLSFEKPLRKVLCSGGIVAPCSEEYPAAAVLGAFSMVKSTSCSSDLVFRCSPFLMFFLPNRLLRPIALAHLCKMKNTTIQSDGSTLSALGRKVSNLLPCSLHLMFASSFICETSVRLYFLYVLLIIRTRLFRLKTTK